MIYKCKYCGKEFDNKQKLGGHVKFCKSNPNLERNLNLLKKARAKIKKSPNHIHKGKECSCQYCGRLYKLYGLKNHERYCNCNPNRSEYSKSYSKSYKHGGGGWNKGLTKETDERVLKQCETYRKHFESGKIVSPFKGKHWSEEDKKKISESRKKYLQEHPEKIPYRINHSSHMSYPEHYFKDLFEQENISLKYHLQVGLYELDFYNEEYKVYVEIDGDTHKQKKVQDIDKRKDDYLQSLGWKGMRISWANYQKLSYEEKELEVEKIRNFVH